MAKYKTEDLLNLKYEENKELFQKVLRKIKPFKNISLDEDLEITKLEKLMNVYEKKYAIMLSWLLPVIIPGEEKTIWSTEITNTDSGEMYKPIYGNSLYEIFTKICILYYSEVEKGLPLKKWNEMQKEKMQKYKENKKK